MCSYLLCFDAHFCHVIVLCDSVPHTQTSVRNGCPNSVRLSSKKGVKEQATCRENLEAFYCMLSLFSSASTYSSDPKPTGSGNARNVALEQKDTFIFIYFFFFFPQHFCRFFQDKGVSAKCKASLLLPLRVWLHGCTWE